MISLAHLINLIRFGMRPPSILSLKQVYDASETSAQINGKWVPARPAGYPSFTYRCKAAWRVFTGKADALVWPEGQ